MPEFRFVLGLVIPLGFTAAVVALVLVARRAAGYRSALAACVAVVLSAIPAVNMSRGLVTGNWSASVALVVLLACGIVYLVATGALVTMAVKAKRHGELTLVRRLAAILTAAVVASYGTLYFFAALSSGG